MSVRYHAAAARLRALENEIEQILRDDYPVGAAIQWLSPQGGGKLCTGRVERHAMGAQRIKVVNDSTGRAYWIHGWRIFTPATRRLRGAA